MELAQRAVERAISTMWNHYSEPLSLDDIADTAILSKFYFSRVFRSVTGTSPGRFLTAVRLYRAKNLLLETSLSVTDIAYHVGYNSLGTFTTRFTRSVGTSPARFRLLSSTGMLFPPVVNSRHHPGALHGKVRLPTTDMPVRIYVGAFGGPIVEGPPAACDVLDRAASYHLSGLPHGAWFVRAAAVALRDVDPRPWTRRPVFVGACHPVTMKSDPDDVEVDIEMHPVGSFDLPILLALPELDSQRLPEPVCARVAGA
jgi:AraC family transcriptional regulator